MESLIEQAVCTNTKCYTCGILVYDVEKKKTTKHVYHNQCFRCRICKRNLTASSLNEEGDDIYCTNCYRKKQRGDCNSLDFQRAASEKAAYVYNDRHPDQPLERTISQRSRNRDFLRHPSWTLRQLERKFLSLQETKTTTNEKTNDKYQKVVSFTHPLTLKPSFSTPINLAKFQLKSSLKKDEPSPFLHFSPAFSPFPNNRITSMTSTPKQFNETKSTFDRPSSSRSPLNRLRSRLNQSSVELTSSLSPINERKHSIEIDTKNYNDTRGSIFRFPDVNTAPLPRRSTGSFRVLN